MSDDHELVIRAHGEQLAGDAGIAPALLEGPTSAEAFQEALDAFWPRDPAEEEQ